MKKYCMTLAGLVLLAVAFAAMAPCACAAGEGDTIVLDGSTTVGPIAKAFAEYYMSMHPEVNVTVSESGSGNGAKSLINGTCDVANMSRFMKPSEVKAAVDKGITPVVHVVAMDGIAVIVHPANPVENLTLEQIRDIYTGKVTSWKELGGPDMKIVTISRDTNSGTFETFKKLVMKDAKVAGTAEYVGSNGALRARVQTTKAAIGYVGLGFVDRSIKALKVNGVYPEQETVSSGRYPVARRLFMFTNGCPKLGSHLHSFVSLYLTKKGQEIVKEIGFVPVTQY